MIKQTGFRILFLLAIVFLAAQSAQAVLYKGNTSEVIYQNLVALNDMNTDRKVAQYSGNDRGTKRVIRRIVRKRSVPSGIRSFGANSQSLREAYDLLNDGDEEEAALLLYDLSTSGSKRNRAHAKFLLGQALMKMGFDLAAAYQFASVIKQGRNPYVEGAIEFLTLAASNLGDDSLINYAVSRLKDRRYSNSRKNIIYFRKGELYMRKKRYSTAAKAFRRVRPGSPYFLKAKYNEALAYSKDKNERRALRVIDELIEHTSDRAITDDTRVSAMLAKARIHYQKKEWDEAIATYREIPRDSVFWHDTVFEQSWAYLMAAQFRSALSNFHTLHSPFYEKFFLPESLILRAIVYLYICRYDEVKKVISLFERLYSPLEVKLKRYMLTKPSRLDYYADFVRYVDYWIDAQNNPEAEYDGPIPQVIASQMMKDGEMRKLFGYMETMRGEQARLLDSSGQLQSSRLGQYIRSLVRRQMKKGQEKVGRRVQRLVKELRGALRGYIEQNGFLNFELINMQKTKIKKRMSGEDEFDDEPREKIDDNEERDFYVQNGFHYWPFKGEYWLDELGNYHFLGVQSCGE